jgi:hypothetical protein
MHTIYRPYNLILRLATNRSTYLDRIGNANFAILHHNATDATRTVADVAYGRQGRVFSCSGAFAADHWEGGGVVTTRALKVEAVLVFELLLCSPE